MATARIVNRGEDQFVLLPAEDLIDCDEVEVSFIDGSIVLTPRPRDPSRPPSADPEDRAIIEWLGTQVA